jgi:hypothetical protein
MVIVSLPTIGRDLHLGATSLQWLVTAYGPRFGGFLLLGGRGADLLGRRRMLMLGLGLFTAASLGCGLATGDAFLVSIRAAQGLGAAGMLPAALSIVTNMFEESAERNKALGIWGARWHRRDRRLDGRRLLTRYARLGIHLLPERSDRGSCTRAGAANRARQPAPDDAPAV